MRAQVIRAARPALLIGALAALQGQTAKHVTAQTRADETAPAPLQGVVVAESTEQPVDAAEVSILGSDRTVTTGRWGSFAFADVAPGPVTLQVRAAGHPSVVLDVEVSPDRVAFVRVVLPSVAAVLSELFVPGSRPTAGPADGARTAADLLALQVPRARISSGEVGKVDYKVRLRPAGTLTDNVEPLVLLDGVVLANERVFAVLEQIPASEVAEIEVLRGPAAAFRYPYAANGVVHVKTKKGRPRS